MATDRENVARRFPVVARWRTVVVVAVAVVAIAISTTGGIGPWHTSSSTSRDADEVAEVAGRVVDEAIADLDAAPARSAVISQSIQPSMVLIETDVIGSNAQRDESLGAGVVVDDEATILTAWHVVEGAETIQVTFADGTKSRARVVSKDADTDVAVVKTEKLPEVVVPAVLGGGVGVGDEVVVVGHPFGLVASVSAGVVSGVDRSISVRDGKVLDGLIQFDAAANPGNSGGPLLDAHGRVVGVVTALANPNEEPNFIGIGFAVPIATAGGVAGAPPR